ncbi:MAG: hypothetical protein ACRDJ0_05370 [Actinomycetota bacterium]
MILPTVLIIALVAAWPIIYAIYLSFQRILPNITEWTGINNCVVMFGDSTFWIALLNTGVSCGGHHCPVVHSVSELRNPQHLLGGDHPPTSRRPRRSTAPTFGRRSTR